MSRINKEEVAMFWAGVAVGLILGIPLGIFAFSFMTSAKRSQDDLDRAVSDMELQALSEG